MFTDDTAPPQAPDIEAAFVEWWAAVPRKVAKGAALRAYRSALKHATPADLLAGIRRFAAEVEGREERFIAHPATWLNGQRWLDEPGRQGVDHEQHRQERTQPRRNGWAVAAERLAQERAGSADGAGDG
ncbi:hypothetical protein [Azospirillum argentinense]|uniref:hypothetical protein n=1 Tax=Azospirillum argentinense TaxID=2970906 RepID=UPI001909DF06|nr:hypothetical protein [Azospirillum argentinense]